jgi:hypothetical protein
MAQRFRKRRTVLIVLALAVFVLALMVISFLPPAESKYLKDPTLVATKPRDFQPTFAPKPPSSIRTRLYKMYHEVFPPPRGKFTFRGRGGPSPCSIHGLMNQCHEVSGVQFFIDKHVASGSVMFGHTNTMNGPEWVAAFTNAVQTGEVQWWDPNKKDFRHENPVFIPAGRNSYLVLPKNRVAQYRAE